MEQPASPTSAGSTPLSTSAGGQQALPSLQRPSPQPVSPLNCQSPRAAAPAAAAAAAPGQPAAQQARQQVQREGQQAQQAQPHQLRQESVAAPDGAWQLPPIQEADSSPFGAAPSAAERVQGRFHGQVLEWQPSTSLESPFAAQQAQHAAAAQQAAAARQQSLSIFSPFAQQAQHAAAGASQASARQQSLSVFSPFAQQAQQAQQELSSSDSMPPVRDGSASASATFVSPFAQHAQQEFRLSFESPLPSPQVPSPPGAAPGGGGQRHSAEGHRPEGQGRSPEGQRGSRPRSFEGQPGACWAYPPHRQRTASGLLPVQDGVPGPAGQPQTTWHYHL